MKRSVLNTVSGGFNTGCVKGSAPELGAMTAIKLDATLFWSLSTGFQ